MQLFLPSLSDPVAIKRANRARRFALRVSRLDGRVTLSMPQRATLRAAQAFLAEHESWLVQTLAQIAPRQSICMGGQVLFEGRQLRLEQGAAGVIGDTLFVRAGAAQIGVRVAAVLKVLARERLVAACDHYAAMLGREYKQIRLRDTRSRWGSCGADGTLMFSWRLIMAPPWVLQYVAAHEVAHLVHMNHSAAFWDVVASVYPDWQRARDWLRQNGGTLHQYQFMHQDEVV